MVEISQYGSGEGSGRVTSRPTLQLIKQSPIYGHGIAVSSRLAKWSTTNTHNGLIAVLLGTGAIGFAMILLGMYRLLTEVRSSLRVSRVGAIGCTSAFVAAFVNNMSISFIGEQWRAPSLVFFCVFGSPSLFRSYIIRARRGNAKRTQRYTRHMDSGRQVPARAVRPGTARHPPTDCTPAVSATKI